MKEKTTDAFSCSIASVTKGFCCDCGGGFNILVIPNFCLNSPSSFEEGM